MISSLKCYFVVDLKKNHDRRDSISEKILMEKIKFNKIYSNRKFRFRMVCGLKPGIKLHESKGKYCIQM